LERITTKSAKEIMYTFRKFPGLSKITVKFGIQETTVIAHMM